MRDVPGLATICQQRPFGLDMPSLGALAHRGDSDVHSLSVWSREVVLTFWQCMRWSPSRRTWHRLYEAIPIWPGRAIIDFLVLCRQTWYVNVIWFARRLQRCCESGWDMCRNGMAQRHVCSPAAGCEPVPTLAALPASGNLWSGL